ncbi:hypothetical protein AB1A81_05685 [Bdellovibrio bacteriovorus]|uniref:Lipoprotein n=1 Tax=Bdellovibrio bacteriovorus (strain ATCC 15356 / DSM 50701 / NCIMB 9529 / HD100) TaxID=264462 RepID=Q6MNK3_BDEBA|nr:hypothetical protein [Bdellovibrio bacteriovorus]CAE79148.1 hypothetical protein predicted by Glimmer/Critica [Bdellovibrio bacteriovorus HD100]
MKKILGIFAVLFAVGCSKLGEDPSLSEESLEGGQWIAFCFGGNSGWETRKARYDGTNYVESVEVSADSYCNQPAYSIEEQGTYLVGDKLSGGLMRKLDRTLTSIKITPLSGLGVSNLNSGSVCGFTDWTINVAREVTGLYCNGSVPPANTTYYDLYLIFPLSIDDPEDPIAKGDLNFGFRWGGNDGSTEETRPDSVTAPNFKRHPL